MEQLGNSSGRLRSSAPMQLLGKIVVLAVTQLGSYAFICSVTQLRRFGMELGREAFRQLGSQARQLGQAAEHLSSSLRSHTAA